MSKLLWILWKSLLVSPAVLCATLMITSGATRAAESTTKLAAANSQATTEASQPQAAEVKTPEVQSIAKDATAHSLPMVMAMQAVNSASQLATNSQTAVVKAPEVQPIAKDITERHFPMVTAMQAADSASQLATNSQTATQANPLQTAAVQTPEVQPVAKDTKAPTLPVAAATTAPAELNSSVLSTTPTQDKAEPKATEAKVPAKVAIAPSPVTPASQVTEASPQTPKTPRAAEATVAQATPAAPNNTDNLLNQINDYSRQGNGNSQGQVTNVTQLRDVSPSDWAYEALRSLVERYGCIAGYPDGTYRGNRALSRYEFAAGLNACLQQVERLIASNTSDFVRKEDLATLQRLVDEFRTELATLGTRVDKLEGRVGFLEAHQFSTTTKLQGEAIFALTDEFNQAVTNNTVFQDRVRLTFNTSFTGRDRLVTRLAAGNADFSNRFKDSFGQTLSEGQQTFNITGGSANNNVQLDWLAYYFNFGSSKVYLAATGGIHSDYAPTNNPYFEDYDGGNGALSTFASENPIYRIGGGAGAAVSLGVGPLRSILGPSTLTFGYLAGAGNTFGANNPREKAGLFDGDYAALGQLNFNLADRVGVGLTYVHGYHNSGTDLFDLGGGIGGAVVGTRLANNPGSLLAARGLPQVPIITNSYGGELAFRLTDNISLSGFATYTNATLIGRGNADIWTYGGGVAFPDFGKKGNVLGLFAGVEPTLKGADASIRGNQALPRDNAWHFEGFYKYQVTENISVTPGIIWLTAPGQVEGNRDAVIGTLRTTFTF